MIQKLLIKKFVRKIEDTRLLNQQMLDKLKQE